MEVDRNGLEVLDRQECLRLLGAGCIGRLGTSLGALPAVVPVAYQLEDEHVVVRTTAGSRLEAAVPGTVVAFEVDDIDGASGEGWSVSLTGVAHPVDDTGEHGALQRVAGLPWAPTVPGRAMAISTEIISGRRRRGPVGHGSKR